MLDTYEYSEHWFKMCRQFNITIYDIVDFYKMDKFINDYIQFSDIDYDIFYKKLHEDRNRKYIEVCN